MSDKFSDTSLEKMYNLFRDPNSDLSNFSDSSMKNVKENMPILKKVASNCTLEEFKSFIVSHELPAIKLSHREMQVISGGVGFWDYCVGLYEGVKRVFKS